MDSPLGSAGAPDLIPIDSGRCSAPPLHRHLGGHVERPDIASSGASERPTVHQTSPQSATKNGELTIGSCAGYWRHLQSLSWADAEVFSPSELLAILLQFGRSRRQARNRAAQLLDRFGSLGGVMAADSAKLAQVLDGDGGTVILLKTVRAAVKAIVREPLEERPVIGSASALMDYLSVTMRHEPNEVARILFLNCKNGLIKDEILQRGTINHITLYPREVVKRVVELGASAIILVHNHPSGDPTPSPGDVEETRRLVAALGTINVVMHDHVIVGRRQAVSLRKLKLI